jgi:hypothetical protein
MNEYCYNWRSDKTNFYSAIFIIILFSLILILEVVSVWDRRDLNGLNIFILFIPGILVISGIYGVLEMTINSYRIIDDGVTITKIFKNGRQQILHWDDISRVKVRSRRNQCVLTNTSSTVKLIVDFQITNYSDFFIKLTKMFPDL